MDSATVIQSPASTHVFNDGIYATHLLNLDSRLCSRNSSNRPPRPLLICSPSDPGEFPVLIFLHGYLLYNSFYSQLVQHIASHGFVVVAPQLYSIAGPDANQDIKITAEITEWLLENLLHYLPNNVRPNLKKLALSGHSRGGKVAFALALSASSSSPSSAKFSALIGIDPVDGMDKGKQTPPPVLTYKPNSFNLDGTPVLVIGSGFGDMPKNALFPPCAPKGVNHEDFYRECCEPAYYFVAKDCGHLDVLDDETRGLRGLATYHLCKNGVCRKPMRRFVGGVVVAFLNAYLGSDSKALLGIKDGVGMLPVDLEAIDSKLL